MLAEAALICCEDTRRTGRLLQHAGVTAARLAVCNEHTERARVGEVLDVLGEGRDVAVVTDAGTPGISDPGERLVRAVLDAGYEVAAVPGPTAFVAALVTSGLPTGRFVFEGFLPRSGRARTERLAELADEPRTIVLYEAPHRVAAHARRPRRALRADRRVTVARELTKLYETVVRGTLGDVELGTPRGEYVLVVAGARPDDAPPDDDEIRAALRAELAAGRSRRDAATAVARAARRAAPCGVRPRGDGAGRAAPEYGCCRRSRDTSPRHRDVRPPPGRPSMNQRLDTVSEAASEYRQMVGSGPSAAFFDLDRTLISGSSAFILARAARSAGLVPTRQFVRDAGGRWRSSCAARATARPTACATASSAPSRGCARTT